MRGKISVDQLTAAVDRGDIDTVLVALPDMQGRLVGKRVTGHYFCDQIDSELHVCDYLLTVDIEMEPVPGYAAASWDAGYGDIAIRPDLSTLRVVPWLEATAMVICDAFDHHGRPVPHAPRTVLRNQLARLAQRGWEARIGSELEFYLFDETYTSAHESGYRGLAHTGWYIEDYHLFQTTKEEGLIRAVRNAMDAAGVPVEFSKGEWGPGQQEINLRFAEALEMADRHVIYKTAVKEMAWQHDRAATFMAKFDTELAGSSCHVHSSLWADGDRALFARPPGGEDTPEFRGWVAGLLSLAPASTLFFAPNVNSYKRFVSGTFAPTRLAWSEDNRTAGFRAVGTGSGRRIECRIPGADVNPYMVFAATVAAGLHGIDEGLDPGPPVGGNIYEADTDEVPEVPSNLRDAVAELDSSAAMRAALGDDVVDHYIHAARWEIAEHDRRVTDVERLRLFEQG